MMFNALSCLHLITVINKHWSISSYKVNWDKSGLLSTVNMLYIAVYYSQMDGKSYGILHYISPSVAIQINLNTT